MASKRAALYLHIGRNKAGSTTLQDCFAANADWLAGHGVRYALFGHAEGKAGLPMFPGHRDVVRACETGRDPSYLISNEIISEFPLEFTRTMARDLAALDVRVVLYVRPYRDWVRSSYSFDVNTGRNGRDFDRYLEHIAPRISFRPTLEIWGDALGWDRVRVRSIDPRDLAGGNLIADCFDAIGVPAPPGCSDRRSNAAPNWMVIELLRQIVGRDAAADWDPAGYAAASALHQLADEALAATGIFDPGVEYLTGPQASWLADLYCRDLDAVFAATGTRLQGDDARAAKPRPFLPEAARIPRAVLRDIAARAAAPEFVRAHPEAASFATSPSFTGLLGVAHGRVLVPGAARAYVSTHPDGAVSSGAKKDFSFMDSDAGADAVQQLAAQARRLAARGDLLAAIAAAETAVRAAPDADLLAAMARWRVEAYAHAAHPPGPAAWPPNLPDPFPGHIGIPAIDAADMTPAMLGGAILHHGSLRVNGLVSADAAETLRLGIQRAFAARDAAHAGAAPADPGWYVPLEGEHLETRRSWVENGGAVWTADSPAMLFAVIEAFTQAGVIDHISGLMGERPALSVGKSTLRRVPVVSGTDWHQDGAFLGREVRSVNVWLALSPCGVDAPGLEVVGRRLPYIVQTGSHGAIFDWSVGPGMVDILADGGAPVESPAFAAGDALLFDHMMLHRTGVRPGMTRERWAIESWFFAPTHYPLDQVPLLV